MSLTLKSKMRHSCHFLSVRARGEIHDHFHALAPRCFRRLPQRAFKFVPQTLRTTLQCLVPTQPAVTCCSLLVPLPNCPPVSQFQHRPLLMHQLPFVFHQCTFTAMSASRCSSSSSSWPPFRKHSNVGLLESDLLRIEIAVICASFVIVVPRSLSCTKLCKHFSSRL